MSDEQQANGGNVAGVNTPTPTPNGSANPQDTVEYWKAQAEQYESRYKGASTKINEYDKSVKTWQQKYAEVLAEAEGLRASTSNEVTDWKTKHQTLEQQAAEQAKKLAQYERKENLRALINTDDFADLAPDFEKDKIFQFGLLTAAEQMDDAALKIELAKTLQLRKGQRQAAVESATNGATPTPPASGNTPGSTVEQIIAQLGKLPANDPQRPALMAKWAALRDKKS